MEHAKNLKKSVKELKRVTSKRLILIVPKQKFSEFTPDLHTYFFENKNELINVIGINKNKDNYIENDIFFIGDII